MQYIENKTFDEIAVGDTARIERVLGQADIDLFGILSGDVAPVQDAACEDIEQGMWGTALIAAVLGSELPGVGTAYVSQSLEFHRAIAVGDTVTVIVTVLEKAAGGLVVLSCQCLGAVGEVLISGRAKVIAPKEKVRRPRRELPAVHLHVRGARHAQLVAAAQAVGAIATAVIHPCDADSLLGALAARDAGLIVPVLVGPLAKIRAVAVAQGVSLDGIELVDTAHSHAAAAAGVAMAREGKVAALMKGKLHTDEIMAAVVDSATGLRTDRRISHVFALDVPHYDKPLFITDAAINIEPDLNVKRDIIQNAIDLAHALGIKLPKVAILSAVETVTPAIRSTVEAAALCKMAERGQISGGVLDGPLAFDNAVSLEAAKAKDIVSVVAGQADILVAPDMVSGNMIAKQLIYLAGAQSAGLALGARVPIILTSRSDGVAARVASAALATLFAAHQRHMLTAGKA
ncbi:MAG: bifunctional enoyl-CoA hydratase/phosphate acetyltransferase [Cypionkella sp.]